MSRPCRTPGPCLLRLWTLGPKTLWEKPRIIVQSVSCAGTLSPPQGLVSPSPSRRLAHHLLGQQHQGTDA